VPTAADAEAHPTVPTAADDAPPTRALPIADEDPTEARPPTEPSPTRPLSAAEIAELTDDEEDDPYDDPSGGVRVIGRPPRRLDPVPPLPEGVEPIRPAPPWARWVALGALLLFALVLFLLLF
jgi:hypothetical protein